AEATQKVVANALAIAGVVWGALWASAAAWPMPPWRRGIPLLSARWRTTARSAVPSEPATRWMTLMEVVAAGIWGWARSWKAAAIVGVMDETRAGARRNRVGAGYR